MKKKETFICEISIIIIILICQKLGLVEPVQQKTKLPLPHHEIFTLMCKCAVNRNCETKLLNEIFKVEYNT